MFFECSLLEIFGDFGHLRLHFGSHFDDFLREMSFRKNSWKCVTIINFRGLTPPKWSFFASPNDGTLWGWVFMRFLWFWSVLGSHFEGFWAPIVRQKRFWKIMQKSDQKRVRGLRGEFCPGGGGPLKSKNTSILTTIGSNTPQACLAGTVADIERERERDLYLYNRRYNRAVSWSCFVLSFK